MISMFLLFDIVEMSSSFIDKLLNISLTYCKKLNNQNQYNINLAIFFIQAFEAKSLKGCMQ